MTVNKKLICEKMCELLQLTEVGQQIKLKSIDYNPETGEVASSYYSEHFGRDLQVTLMYQKIVAKHLSDTSFMTCLVIEERRN